MSREERKRHPGPFPKSSPPLSASPEKSLKTEKNCEKRESFEEKEAASVSRAFAKRSPSCCCTPSPHLTPSPCPQSGNELARQTSWFCSTSAPTSQCLMRTPETPLLPTHSYPSFRTELKQNTQIRYMQLPSAHPRDPCLLTTAILDCTILSIDTLSGDRSLRSTV